MDKIKIAYKKGYRVTKSGNVIGLKNKEIKGRISNNYLRINFRYNSKFLYFKTHRLQAYQKFGDKIFEQGIVVRHLNGNSLDNSWDNISIGTNSDNMLDIPKKARFKKAMKATSFTRKHDKKEIQNFYNICKSYKKTMNKFNISSKGTLYYLLNTPILT